MTIIIVIIINRNEDKRNGAKAEIDQTELETAYNEEKENSLDQSDEVIRITDGDEDLINQIYSQESEENSHLSASVHDQPKEIEISCDIRSLTSRTRSSLRFFRYLIADRTSLNELPTSYCSENNQRNLEEDMLLRVFNKADFRDLQIVSFFFAHEIVSILLFITFSVYCNYD